MFLKDVTSIWLQKLHLGLAQVIDMKPAFEKELFFLNWSGNFSVILLPNNSYFSEKKVSNFSFSCRNLSYKWTLMWKLGCFFMKIYIKHVDFMDEILKSL